MAWAAGNIVADMDDIARFYRALLGGRLLPPAQMAELKTRVEIVPGVAGYGLGLFVFETDCGSIWGHSGGIPGFGNELFSSEDGTRQYGLMINAETPPAAVYEPFVVASQQALAEAFGRPVRTPRRTAGSRWPPVVRCRAAWLGADRPGVQRSDWLRRLEAARRGRPLAAARSRAPAASEASRP